jgi:hypothetical protein
MDDIAARQPPGFRNHSLSRRTTLRIEPLGFGHNLGSPRPVDRSINPTATRQASIGGIDNSIRRLLGNIPLDEFHYSLANL